MTKKIKEASRRIIMIRYIITNGKELEERCISLRS